MHTQKLTKEDRDKILRIKETYSIYAIFSDSYLFNKIIDALSEPFKSLNVDKIVGVEARAFEKYLKTGSGKSFAYKRLISVALAKDFDSGRKGSLKRKN